jgi:hypothetical protein
MCRCADTFKRVNTGHAQESPTTPTIISEPVEILRRKYHKPITEQLAAQAAERS